MSLVDDLQNFDFVERHPSPDDRRSRIVVLADAGRDALRDTDKASRRVTDDPLAPLGAEQRKAPHTLLLRVSDRDRG